MIAAHETGLRLISVDYMLAPHAQYDQMSDQVVAVIQALLSQGQRIEDMAIYGDSSGGGLAAAVTLKMRDRGLGLPAAAVLVSAWLDVTPSGDTETTLHDSDQTRATRSMADRRLRHLQTRRTRSTRMRLLSTATSLRDSRRR